MQRLKAIAGFFLMLVLSTPAIGQTTAQYIGPHGGLWSSAGNWDNGVVPANGGGNTYNVVIPINKLVVFDLSTPTQITGISMELGSGLALTDTSLEIVGVALLQNVLIDADGAAAEFLTNAPFVSTAANQRVRVEQGALVRLELSKYVFSDRSGSLLEQFVGPILLADGADSLLDLSSVTEFDASQAFSGCCGTDNYTVRASNQGVIDLHNVTTLKGAALGNERLKFRAESGGQINLSGLANITAGNTWLQLAGGTIDASNLVSAVNTRFEVPGGATLDLGDEFVTATNSEFLIGSGGTINAPSLTNISNSRMTLTPTTILNAPRFTQIDNARLHIQAGRSFAVADTKYVLSNGTLLEHAVGSILLADGAGSLLDLSSVTEFDASQAFSGCCGPESYPIRASNQGVIDLHNVTTLKGAGGFHEHLKFRAESGGHINLSGLANITSGKTWLQLAGGTINASNLASTVNTRFDVPVFQTLNMPVLTSATGSEFRIEAGSTVNVPMLTDFANSSITLTPSTFFNAPPFTQIDNARLHVKEGRSFEVADAKYILSNTSLFEHDIGPILSADGAGSLLDLSSVAEIDASQAFTGCCGGASYAFRASNQGVVDLQNTTIIAGPRGADDWLKFRIESGGRIDFGSVGPGQIHGGVWMDVSGSGSKIVATGDFILGRVAGPPPTSRKSRLRVLSLGEVHVGGDMIALITEAALHDTDGGILYMEGSGVQRLEVNGLDNGLPTEAIEDNFNWGRLVVGQAGQATTVALIDGLRFPGNTPPAHALYLSGFPQGANGLSILGGSTLLLNNLNVYVGGISGDEAEWIHLNSLFGPGENVIPYGDGFLQLAAPVVLGDFDGNGTVGAEDYNAWRSEFGSFVFPVGSGADGNGNGVVDAADYVIWRKNLASTQGTGSATPVPEPSWLLMTCLGLITLLPSRERAVVLPNAS
jgi:hypothetical protein